VPTIADAFGDEGWQATGQVPLYAQDPSDGLDLRMAAQIDTLHLGLGLGLLSGKQTGTTPGMGAAPPDAPAAANNHFKEGAW
jgi:hypothetical protein